MRLELAWGQARRAFLRLFCAAYVSNQIGKRQGSCPNCPHDIIDPRDLKYVRNVCGFWFRPEDDRFLGRERLGYARAGLAEIICFSSAFLTLCSTLLALAASVHAIFLVPLPIVVFFWFQSVTFFRDPERTIPEDVDALLSPADGRVTHVHEVPEPEFPGGRALRISIFLSVFDVHVNRLPRSGRVANVRYFPGKFLDARSVDCPVRNEQLWIDMIDGTRPIRVKQISGAIARRIVCWLKPGEQVQAGARLGMIKFGSRTDVLLAPGDAREILVKVGDKVEGGTTILLRVKQ